MSSFSVVGTKYGYNSLASGDVIIKIQVDASQAERALPFFALDPAAHLKVTFEDADTPPGESAKKASDAVVERNNLIAQIHIHAQAIGYSDEQRRRAYRNLTKKETLKDMDLGELKTVEKEFYHTLNPIGDPT